VPYLSPTRAKGILPLGLAFVFLGCVDLSEVGGGSQRYRGTRKGLSCACCRYPKLLRQAGRLRTRADLTTGVKGSVPSDFFYAAGADAWVTGWLTGVFDIVGQRIFGTVRVMQQPFLANCRSCTSSSNSGTVTLPYLGTSTNSSYNATSASMGIKVRPFWQGVQAGIYCNVLVRLDDGGLRSKPAPLAGVGYTF
jgi:hypothetical protein